MIPKIREWLEKTGFSLEMRAASAFRSAGFAVKQSSYYSDVETGKPREMDLEAISRSDFGAVDVRFLVECKSSDKPWVLLCSPDTLVGYNRLFAFAAMAEKTREIFVKRYELLDRFSWLRKDRVIAGYSMRQAFSENDTAYSAAMNVMKACHSRIIESDSFKKCGVFCIAFPIIVVDSPLLLCALNNEGEMQLSEVDEGEFLFSGHELGTCIRVIHVSKLPSFALFAKGVAGQLQDELKDDEQQFRELLQRGGRTQ